MFHYQRFCAIRLLLQMFAKAIDITSRDAPVRLPNFPFLPVKYFCLPFPFPFRLILKLPVPDPLTAADIMAFHDLAGQKSAHQRKFARGVYRLAPSILVSLFSVKSAFRTWHGHSSE